MAVLLSQFWVLNLGKLNGQHISLSLLNLNSTQKNENSSAQAMAGGLNLDNPPRTVEIILRQGYG